ncbi:PhzF family phenazine biosynthesis protein [Deinococcus malanensis]|uniref:PhzF family phenazine biosynthesis protein n=1 Tax=Deinococcus malanensis TaxID=1706855 RepID=UPI003632BB79
MTEPLLPARYRVFAPPGDQGGKLVSVQPAAGEEASTQAAATGTPLTAFVEAVESSLVTLRLFTPTREKGASDSGAIAALAALQSRVPDALDVQMAGETQAAQLCGGEWLLMQGDVRVQPAEADLSGLGLGLCPVWVTSAGRPNLAVQLPDLDTLTSFVPGERPIAELNRATGTSGLLLFTTGGAAHVGMARADVSFRPSGH